MVAQQTAVGTGEVQAFISTAEGAADNHTGFISQLLSHSEGSRAFLIGQAGDSARLGLENLAELLTKQNTMFREIIQTVQSTVQGISEANEESSGNIAQSLASAVDIVNW